MYRKEKSYKTDLHGMICRLQQIYNLYISNLNSLLSLIYSISFSFHLIRTAFSPRTLFNIKQYWFARFFMSLKCHMCGATCAL